tara:strand:- start:113 stop:259 length:147 start_codon:yes stop_codon:yes gene_type:complete
VWPVIVAKNRSSDDELFWALSTNLDKFFKIGNPWTFCQKNWQVLPSGL